MKKVLVIGSTVADVIIRLDKLPATGGDVNIKWQRMSLGGCAFNVSQAVAYSKVPYLLFSPLGTGLYADFVKRETDKKGVTRADINAPVANGCCYCIVEDGGERTFICEHGAEYKYKKEWFDSLDINEFSCAYICGLEVEEPTGDVIIDFLKQSGLKFYFSPGPRINFIEKDKMERIFELRPILHVNKTEALIYSEKKDLCSAAKKLSQMTQNDVVVTDGDNGSYCLSYNDGKWHSAPAVKAEVVDTIGAGDAHVGTYIAQRELGNDIDESLMEANRVSALIVQKEGAVLENNV